MKRFLLQNVKILLFVLSLVVTMLLGALVGIVLVYQKGFPQIRNLEDIQPVVMSTLLDDHGLPIKEFAIEKRIVVASSEIPQLLKNAIVAAEDNQFYSHWGINVRGFLRAVSGVLTFQHRGGGSSITQQLARGLFLTPEFSYSRKLKEMLLAVQIERKYTKDQIITFYCNKIFLGGSVYGVEAASRHYFGKPAKEISAAEAALLAAIIPSANNLYSIFRRPANCEKRRNFVLGKMLELKMIDQAGYQAALTVKLPVRPVDVNRESLADYFAEDTRKVLESKFGDNLLYKGGLRVQTTLNRDMQLWADRALKNGLRALDKRRGFRTKEKLFNLKENQLDLQTYPLPSWNNTQFEPGTIVEGVVLEVSNLGARIRLGNFSGELPAKNAQWALKSLPRLLKEGDVALFRLDSLDPQGKWIVSLEQEPVVEGAILVVDNRTGEIKAMVGGYSFARSKFNRATQALRQTGSTFKPIIYAAALENGFSPSTQIEDAPFTYRDEWTGTVWAPQNHQNDYKGPMTFRRGLEQSRNVITARLLQAITPRTGVDYAKRFGITSDLKPFMSLSLGAFEVTLQEMVEAYTVFPNLGSRVRAYFIRSIRDQNGNVIEENFPERKQVIERETAFVMNYLLQGVVRSGTGYRARGLKTPVGGKTGTTNDFTDAWFIGFTPSLTVGVWVGHDQKKNLGYEETGSKAASPIFVEFMQNYLEKNPETARYSEPSGIVWRDIDKYTGKLATPDCLYPFREAFLPGSEPAEPCSPEEHQKIFNYFKTEGEDESD